MGGRSWVGVLLQWSAPRPPLPSPSGTGPARSVASLPRLWLPQASPAAPGALVTEGRQEAVWGPSR